MTKKDRERYLKLLLKEKERIYRTVGSLKKDALKSSKKDAGGVPTHIADLGTDVFERDLEIDLSNSEGKILALIDEAIGKVRNGSFGRCEVCGTQIPVSRLRVLPYAKYCIRCQREKEQSGE